MCSRIPKVFIANTAIIIRLNLSEDVICLLSLQTLSLSSVFLSFTYLLLRLQSRRILRGPSHPFPKSLYYLPSPPQQNHQHQHHHISFMELGHLLTRSGLTHPEVSSKVYHDRNKITQAKTGSQMSIGDSIHENFPSGGTREDIYIR